MDFLSLYLPQILTAVIAACGATISVTSFVKTLRAEKRTAETTAKLTSDVAITRQGIIEAFKNSQFTTDFKVDISEKVDKVLTQFKQEIIAEISENEKERTQLAVFNAKILQNTAAIGKLSESEKTELTRILAKLERTTDIKIK